MSVERRGRTILCADDYGLSGGVSHAIRMLAAAERISATSCIVTQPKWMQDASALNPLTGHLAVGLHLNFTLGRPLSSGAQLARYGLFPSIARWIAQTYLRQVDRAAVATEISSQLDAFEAGMGVSPDFIDGHEHVHVLPVFRQALLDVLQQRYSGHPLLIRNPSPSIASCLRRGAPRFKSLALRVFTRNLRHDVEASAFTTNDGFAGVSRFIPAATMVSEDFAQAAALDGWRPLVMCHPGFADASLTDTDRMSVRRQAEFDALMAVTPPFQSLWRAQRSTNGTIDWPHVPLEQRI